MPHAERHNNRYRFVATSHVMCVVRHAMREIRFYTVMKPFFAHRQKSLFIARCAQVAII